MCFSAVAYIKLMQSVMLKYAYENLLATVYIRASFNQTNSTHGNTVNTVFKAHVVIQWIQCSKCYVKRFKAHQNCTRYVVRIVYFSVCVSTWLRISKIVIDEALIHTLACLAHRLLSLVLLAAAAWALWCLCVNGKICIKVMSSTVNEQSNVNSYVQYI